ncbi:hypothetical protein TWF718_005291 [Orbilia javanica]|uniref:BTB domain-containing protein n=1 Tax=Orbilia javanica TaxID=47235 RepID=A0AAN8N028_9PEZI
MSLHNHMAAIQEIVLVPSDTFGSLSKLVPLENTEADFDDPCTEYFRGPFANLWKCFINQEFTDVVIKVITSTGAAYSLGAHRVVLATITALKDKLKNGEPVIELHGINTRCFLHLIAYAYTGMADSLIFGQVHLPGVNITERHSRPAQAVDDMCSISDTTSDLDSITSLGTLTRSCLPPSASIEEKLFQVNLFITARASGLDEVCDVLSSRWALSRDLSSCACGGGHSCPLLAANFDKETWLEYFRLVYTNCAEGELPRRELAALTMLMLQAEEEIPEVLQIVFNEVPQFAKEVLNLTQEFDEEERYFELKR